MSNYTDLLTESEVKAIVSQYLQANGNPDEVKNVLDLLAFYGECKLIFDGIVSGDFEITGTDSSGIRYRLTEKARRRLH